MKKQAYGKPYAFGISALANKAARGGLEKPPAMRAGLELKQKHPQDLI